MHARIAAQVVTGLSVEIRAPDIDPLLQYNIPISAGTASGTVRVTAGSDREIILHTFDGNGVETHRGSDTVDIVSGQNPPLEITTEPLHGDQEISATIGTYIVVADPAADTILVGDSVQLAAAVLGSLGSIVPDVSVHRATLAPSRPWTARVW